MDNWVVLLRLSTALSLDKFSFGNCSLGLVDPEKLRQHTSAVNENAKTNVDA